MTTSARGARRGVYFLANDAMSEMTTAFLNSFRCHNSVIPLCLIPYDGDFRRVAGLRDRYDFSIFSNRRVLAGCDALSRRFHGRTRGEYRKLCAWEGDFDEFIYIDVDTVLLSAVDFVFGYLEKFDFLNSHSNMPEIVRYVWKPTARESGLLSDEQIDYSTNTGFIASRKSALSLAGAEAAAEGALTLAPHMELDATHDQPFINYLIVTSGRPYTSLSVLAYGVPNGDRSIRHEVWAGSGGWKARDGQLYMPRHQPYGVLLVHWAGLGRPGRLAKLVYRLLVALRFMRPEKCPQVRRKMPLKDLWLHYRRLESPACLRERASRGRRETGRRRSPDT